MKSIIDPITCLQKPGQNLVLLLLRLGIGWQLFLTGKGKLTHVEQVTSFFASLHIPAPAIHAIAIGLIELVGGIALIFGVGARIASALISAAMMGAYLTAHRDEAFASSGDFIEAAPFPYLTVALVVLVFGPGGISLDQILTSLLAKRAEATQGLSD